MALGWRKTWIVGDRALQEVARHARPARVGRAQEEVAPESDASERSVDAEIAPSARAQDASQPADAAAELDGEGVRREGKRLELACYPGEGPAVPVLSDEGIDDRAEFPTGRVPWDMEKPRSREAVWTRTSCRPRRWKLAKLRASTSSERLLT